LMARIVAVMTWCPVPVCAADRLSVMVTLARWRDRQSQICTGDIWGWSPLSERKKMGDRATPRIQDIWFCVCRVALRIGTKSEAWSFIRRRAAACALARLRSGVRRLRRRRDASVVADGRCVTWCTPGAGLTYAAPLRSPPDLARFHIRRETYWALSGHRNLLLAAPLPPHPWAGRELCQWRWCSW